MFFEVSGWVVGVASLLYSVYQSYSNKKAEQRTNKSFEHISLVLSSIRGVELPNNSSAIQTVTQDVNGDGREELLVSFPVGAHGANTKVFAWNIMDELHEIGTLSGDHAPYFYISPLNSRSTSAVIITTLHRNYDSLDDSPLRRNWQWNGSEFVEVFDSVF